MKNLVLIFMCLFPIIARTAPRKSEIAPLVGAYYFDGWSGTNAVKNESWAINAPIHLTKKMIEDYSEREPLWGWRDDSVQIMEKQIDLAAANGIDFFLFCWYWSDNKKAINPIGIKNNSLNTSLELFMRARNKYKMKFALLVANHGGFEILGKDNWDAATNYWFKYFKDPQYLCVNNCPLVAIFGSDAVNPYIQEMKKTAKNNGFKGLTMVSCGHITHNNQFDLTSWYNIREKEPGYAQERSYKQLVNHAEKTWNLIPDSVPIIPTVMGGWDNRPGENNSHGVYYTGKTPTLFKKHLKNAIHCVQQRPASNPKIVFIYAWNELGEGGYLVPTKEDSTGIYLKAVKKAKLEMMKK